ncbi:MAG: class I SAM-dependent methyltransferase [Ferrimicrobium sp.]
MVCATQQNPTHYDRPFSGDGATSLDVIAQRITTNATVLDIGCATGMLGRFLTEQKECIVDGIDINQSVAQLLQNHYRAAYVGDLEGDVIDQLEDNQYDFIVCGDILEHLRDPAQLLRNLRTHLTSKGRFLLSVPNIAHAGVLAEMLTGEFMYRPTGLLDSTHIHFFTQRSVLRLLEESGLAGHIISNMQAPLDSTEFNYLGAQHSTPTNTRFHNYLSTYQFVVEAATAKGNWLNPPPLTAALSIGLLGRQSDEQWQFLKVDATPLDTLSHETNFDLDEDAHGELALAIGGNPGSIWLTSIEAKKAGTTVWNWEKNQFFLDKALSIGVEYKEIAAAERGRLLHLTSNRPIIPLPLPKSVLRTADNLTLTFRWGEDPARILNLLSLA